MDITLATDILAAGQGWWEMGIGKTIHSIMIFVAGIMMMAAIVNLIIKAISGQWGKGVTGLIGALILSTLLAFPQVIQTAINTTKGLLESTTQTVDQIHDENGGSGNNSNRN